MKENKELKSNANYFQKGETLRWISIGLLVLTAVLYFFGMGYISYIIMSIGLPLGAILFVISTFGRSSQADIDTYVKRHTENVGYRTDDPQELEKRILKNISVQTAEGYDFGEGLMYKRDKNQQLRSSRYHKAVIYPFVTGLFICSRRLSLVSDEVEDAETEIPYADIVDIGTRQEEKSLTFGKNTFRAKETLLVIERTDGTSLLFPIQDSVATDEFVEKLRRHVAESKTAE